MGGSVVVFVGNAIGMGSNFITRAAAARYLGPADYGQIAMGLTLLEITGSIVLLGLHQGIARQIHRREDAGEVFLTSIYLAFPLAVVVAGLAVLLSGPISALFDGRQFESVLTLFALSLPLLVYLELLTGGYRGLEEASYRVVTKDLLYKGLLAVVVLAAAIAGVDTVGIAGSWFVSLTVASAVGTYIMFTRTELLSVRTILRTPSVDVLSSLSVLSLPLMVSGASWLMMQYVDVLILGLLRPTSEVGVYDAAYSLASLVMVVSSTFAFLFLPMFSKLEAAGRLAEMDRFYKIVTKWMVFVTLPPVVVLLVLPGPILTLVFGSSYATGSTAFSVVLLGFLFSIVAGNTNESIIALGDTRILLLGNVAALGLNVAANVLLVPRLGIVGAALATLLSYVAVNGFYGYYLYLKTGIHPLYPSMARPVVVAGATFIGVSLALRYAEVSTPLLPLLLLATAFLYALVLVVFGAIDTEEREVLHSVGEEFDVDVSRAIDALDRFS